jgi:uncharacterized protein
MQKRDSEILFSASDIVNYLECAHLTTLDLKNLETPLETTEDTEDAKLIQQKGDAHEGAYLAYLQGQHASVATISNFGGIDKRVEATLQAMQSGEDIIYQAAFRDDIFLGYADFLRKVNVPSNLGSWSYEVLDTKLARSPRAKFLIQLGFYSRLLEKVQGVAPARMIVVLGDKREVEYRTNDYSRYLGYLTTEFVERTKIKAFDSYPLPCAKCNQCRWAHRCDEQRRGDDHLSEVANIRNQQILKLEEAGCKTLKALSELPEESVIPGMPRETFVKLRRQAVLQASVRPDKDPSYEVLPIAYEPGKGMTRLPAPVTGDLFFDMEGDPLEEGGLEYLFGLWYQGEDRPVFRAFWAHSRAEEREAFEAVIDFVTGWLHAHPGAHIYHYAPYEETAVKRLMTLHGTREAEVDDLLRHGKLVDLFKVVREALCISEPRYSLKNVEHLYRGKRTGEVKNAGASIVFYEKWKETRDNELLREIEDYNREDVESTAQLRDWLVSIRAEGVPWFHAEERAADESKVSAAQEAEQRLLQYRVGLVDSLPVDRFEWTIDQRIRELVYFLLDFHRRAMKPVWWAMFSRMDMEEDELLEDIECLAALRLEPASPPWTDKRSLVWTYTYPPQESKLKTGDEPTVVATGETVSGFALDEDNLRVTFRRGAKKDPLPALISLGPRAPITTEAIAAAVRRFADSLIERDGRYGAVYSILAQDEPKLVRGVSGSPIVSARAELREIIAAVSRLDASHLFIQGPPGSGKTYTGSHVIVALLRDGCRVGITSNSHKVVHNLLGKVVAEAKAQGFVFSGAKKSSGKDPDSEFDGEMVENVSSNEGIVKGLEANRFQLVSGTAWLFCDPGMDEALDYLVVDEAGQVALANLVGIGTSAKNIVLLGDQMQLGQPIQGLHPGRSGESTLDYLLDGLATIPPERGVFLPKTYRMHPDVCRFISQAVYDGRLLSDDSTKGQRLVIQSSAHPALRETGVRYLPIDHVGCAQRSVEEAELVQALVASLIAQRYIDKQGTERPMTLENILVVAPFNMQVNLLKSMLPEGTKIGTVDKFQGQEAEVVIVSMATSSGENLPRNIEFLYSKNRLNVAISRAKCLTLFIANPKLMSIRCSNPEQMALVNTLCWVAEYGS